MKEMVDEGKLGVRLWVMVREDNAVLAPKLAQYRMIDYGNGHLTVRAIKQSIDGALGSRGAWLLEPYSDKPDSDRARTRRRSPRSPRPRGSRCSTTTSCASTRSATAPTARRSTSSSSAFKANPAKKDLRWRVEHAQHLSAADIPRFGQLGVIASMQGIHCTSDAPYVLERLGAKRAEEGAYVWQKLMKSGAVVDQRHRRAGRGRRSDRELLRDRQPQAKDGTVFFPDQRMSRMEALKSYTINGAYAAFEKAHADRSTVGKYADITVLSKDILTVPEDQIPTAQVVYTIVGGKDPVQEVSSSELRSRSGDSVFLRPSKLLIS